MVHLMHLLFSVRVNIYLNSRLLFDCLGELPSEGLSPVVEIPHETFAVRSSVCAVLRVDHITHLGVVSPPDWHTRPCERAGKTAGAYHIDLACWGLSFVYLDSAAWLLKM